MDSVAGFLIYERTLGSSPVLDMALVIAGSLESQVSVLFMNLLKAGSSLSFFNKCSVSSVFFSMFLEPHVEMSCYSGVVGELLDLQRFE